MAQIEKLLYLDGPFREPRYKRAFDLSVLVVAHLLLAPLWILLWALVPLIIKLQDGGPVFYSQARIGRGGYVFTVRKFRTMVVDAERQTGPVWSQRDDPRITRFGRFLRRTALDELPQILNVWHGEMSIVGPRPERPELHAEFAIQVPMFDARLQVRPGMAGMAQVHAFYDSPPVEKLRHDLAYIHSMSLWLDIKLLTHSAAKTLVARWDSPRKQAAGRAWQPHAGAGHSLDGRAQEALDLREAGDEKRHAA
jgi:lipopolysaccharide/colanic/teichoic acid biosynthesis glycosyltransferase